MPLRQIDDGHASPLDMEYLERNLVSRLKALRGEILALQRDANVAPGPNTLTHQMLYNDVSPESSKAYSEMNSLDLVRLVSSHDKKLIAGMPAIENDTLYFEVGSVEDKETLDAASGAYGMRAGQAQNMEIIVRYHGSSASPITLTHVEDTATEEVIQDSGTESWFYIIDSFGNSMAGMTEYYYSQKIMPGVSVILKSVKAYFKREAVGVTSAKLHMAIYTDYPSQNDKPWPDYLYNLEYGHPPDSINKKAEVIVDIDTGLSTTGEWVEFVLPAPYLRLSAGRTYHIVFWASDGMGTVSGHLYIAYKGSGGYAAGFLQNFIPLTYDYWQGSSDGRDLLLKLETLAETETTLVTPSSYVGWQEASADVTLRMAHDLWEKSNFADFYLTVPEGVAVNALCLRDKASGGEAHWRCDHVRTRHIIPAGRGGAVVDSATSGNTNAIATTSTSYVDMANMSVTLNLSKACVVLVIATVRCATDADGRWIYGQITDGNNNALSREFPLSRFTVSREGTLHCLVSASAGSNTYKLRWRASAGQVSAFERTISAIAF